MEGFEAVYIIENAQQFWSGTSIDLKSMICGAYLLDVWTTELEETLHVPPLGTLSRLDSALKSFITLCSSYHGASHAYDDLVILLIPRYRAVSSKSHAVGALL